MRNDLPPRKESIKLSFFRSLSAYEEAGCLLGRHFQRVSMLAATRCIIVTSFTQAIIQKCSSTPCSARS